MFVADDLTRLAKACGAKPSPAVVDGIVANQEWLSKGGIDTPARNAEFLAQACLETDYFRVLEEYASGAAYEGRKDLGNTVAGDGKKFKGRGIFQCTGRANYAAYGKRLGLDLLKEPVLATRPDISVRIAVMYWNDKGLSAYADQGDTKAISRAINRGSPKAAMPANHEPDRIKIATLARSIIKFEPAKAGDQSEAGILVAEQKQQVEAVTATTSKMEAVQPPLLGSAPSIRHDGAFTAPPNERSWWSSVLTRLFSKEP